MKIRRFRLRFGLPLLSRELADQASHLRHYVLRCLCAIGMFATCFVGLNELISRGELFGFSSLGRGIILVDYVTRFQAVVILLFLPAMTCGAIAGEKERNTLAVLLTTRLGPLTIVLEKLASRLVVVFMLLFLSVPLLAVAYSMGGVSLSDLLTRLRDLAELSFFVASLSLMCSAWCGSTVSAFFMSYTLAGVLVLGTAGLIGYSLIYDIGRPGPVLEQFLILIVPVVFLAVAARCLIRRAFVTPRNFLLAMFRGLDNLYNRMNVLVGDVVLVREKALLPEDKPIAWRETAKKSLGTVRYRVRILVAIELPTAFLLISTAEATHLSLAQGVAVASGLWFTVWTIASVLVAVSCASIVSGERTRQTLPVLLSTPVPGDGIVRQLFAGPGRLIHVLWVPFATIAGFDYWFHQGASGGAASIHERLFCQVVEMAVYPYFIGWSTFYLGTRMRSALWAVLASLLGLLTVVLGPYLAALLVEMWIGRDAALPFFYMSPASILIVNESEGATLLYTCINFAIFGGLTFLVRTYCLQNADRLLGRSVAPPDTRSQTTPMTRAFSLTEMARRRPSQGSLVSEQAH